MRIFLRCTDPWTLNSWKLVGILSLETLLSALFLRLREKHTTCWLWSTNEKRVYLENQSILIHFFYYRNNSSSEYIVSRDVYLLSYTLQNGENKNVSSFDMIFLYFPGSTQENNGIFFWLIEPNFNLDIPIGSELALHSPTKLRTCA
jgi:hypothetical protein